MVLAPEIARFYQSAYDEAARLDQGYFPLERARTQEILLRHMPPAPAVVLDVGGGAGSYALWLAARGHEVHLVDPVPRHVDQALAASARAARPLASAQLGDARGLHGVADASAEVVLLLGPLYHLTERGDRLLALGEARRVLKPGGLVAAAGISRFASYFDWLLGRRFDDPLFARLVRGDLADGQHRNDTGDPWYFTTSFFHRPAELRGEMEEAGLGPVELLPVEGAGALVQDFAARWADARLRAKLMDAVQAVEREPWALDVSPHLLGLGRRR